MRWMILAVLVLVGCGDDSPTAPGPDAVAITPLPRFPVIVAQAGQCLDMKPEAPIEWHGIYGFGPASFGWVRWEAPHRVTIPILYLGPGEYEAYDRSVYEAGLADILQTSDVPVGDEPCSWDSMGH